MRCPDCRHRIAVTRWLRMPGTLVCYHCETLLERGGPASALEVVATWALLMVPFAALFTIGGMGGVVALCALGALIYPLQPWHGFSYQLAAINEPKGLPVARTVGRDGTVNTDEAPAE